MPGLEANTESYNQPLPVSPLDIAGKIGGLQQQKLQIDQVKLDQANQGLTYMTRAMGALGPDAPKEAYIKAAKDAVQMGLVPENQLHVFEAKAAAAPDSKSFFNEFMTAAADHQQQINYHLGQPANNATGQTVTPTVRSVKPGFGERPIGLPVQQQNPPSTPSFDENGQPRLLGPQAPQVAPGAASGPTPLPVERPIPRVSGPTGPTIRTDADKPASFAERTDAAFPKPAGPAAGPSPLFDEGKKQYVSDQELATQKLTAVKPALLALDKIPELRSGPGTKTWNEAVAALKANGVISIDAKNDSTAVYQEVNKYLSQYLKGRGTRSDADLVAAEESSPNVGKQISPALLKLTQTAVAQDRIEAARHTQFKKDSKSRTDFQNYGSYRAGFPASMDERAFIVDKMTPEQKQDLAKDIAKMKPEEKQRFVRSLKAYEDSKVSGNE